MKELTEWEKEHGPRITLEDIRNLFKIDELYPLFKKIGFSLSGLISIHLSTFQIFIRENKLATKVQTAIKNKQLDWNYKLDNNLSTRELYLSAIQNEQSIIVENIPMKYKDDKEIALAIINKGSWNFEHLSNDLQNNREVFLAAIKKKLTVYSIPEKLCNDKEVVLEAINNTISNGVNNSTFYNILKSLKKLKDDKDVIIAAIKKDGGSYKYASYRLQNDKDVFLSTCNFKRKRSFVEKLPPKLNNDKEVVLLSVNTNANNYFDVSNKLKNDPDVIIASIREANSYYFFDKLPKNIKYKNKYRLVAEEAFWSNWKNRISDLTRKSDFENEDIWHIQHLLKSYKSDKKEWNFKNNTDSFKSCKQEVVDFFERWEAYFTVQIDGLALKGMSEKLKNDEEIVIEAVKQNGLALQFSSDGLKSNYTITKAAVWQNGMALKFASPEMKATDEIIETAVFKNGLAIKYAAPELLANKKIIITAVRETPKALLFVNKVFRDDEEIILASEYYSAMRYASPRLKKDKEFIIKAIRKNSGWFDPPIKYINKKLKQDTEILLEIIRRSPKEYNNVASIELKTDKLFILKAISLNPLVLKFLDKKLQIDREIIFTAIENSDKYDIKELLEIVGIRYKNDKKFMLMALKIDALMLEFASDKLKNDLKFVLEAVKQNGEAFQFASESLRSNKKLFFTAMWSPFDPEKEYANWDLLKYISRDLKNDRELFYKIATGREAWRLSYASDEILNDKKFMDDIKETNRINSLNAEREAREWYGNRESDVNWKGYGKSEEDFYNSL